MIRLDRDDGASLPTDASASPSVHIFLQRRASLLPSPKGFTASSVSCEMLKWTTCHLARLPKFHSSHSNPQINAASAGCNRGRQSPCCSDLRSVSPNSSCCNAQRISSGASQSAGNSVSGQIPMHSSASKPPASANQARATCPPIAGSLNV